MSAGEPHQPDTLLLGFAAALRAGDPAVLGRLERGRCLLDLRALDPGADAALVAAVRAADPDRG